MECSLKQGEWSEVWGKLNRVLLEINIWSADRDKLNKSADRGKIQNMQLGAKCTEYAAGDKMHSVCSWGQNAWSVQPKAKCHELYVTIFSMRTQYT